MRCIITFSVAQNVAVRFLGKVLSLVHIFDRVSNQRVVNECSKDGFIVLRPLAVPVSFTACLSQIILSVSRNAGHANSPKTTLWVALIHA